MSDAALVCLSEYVVMPDGARLAVSAWLPKDIQNRPKARPAILTTTRYWRAMAFTQDKPEYQFYHPYAS